MHRRTDIKQLVAALWSCNQEKKQLCTTSHNKEDTIGPVQGKVTVVVVLTSDTEEAVYLGNQLVSNFISWQTTFSWLVSTKLHSPFQYQNINITDTKPLFE